MIHETSPTPRQGALLFARRGYAVLPLHSIDDETGGCTCGKDDCTSPGKHPFAKLAPNGVKNATADTNVIKRWFLKRPWLNYGVATGALLVVDVDKRHGGLERWKEITSKTISTWQVRTGSGGLHIIFENNAGIRCGTLERGIDLRGIGGYIVGPYSKHASGKRYRWLPQCGPKSVDLIKTPDWLATLIQNRTHQGTITPIEEWRRRAREPAEDGERHDRFMKLAGHLIARMIDPEVARDLMLAWNEQNCRPPLAEHDALTMIEAIIERELAKIEGRSP